MTDARVDGSGPREMLLRARTLVFAFAVVASCKKNPVASTQTSSADRPTAVVDAAAVDNAPLTPPQDAVFVLRGSGLRKVLNIVAPGAPTRLALGQLAPNYSPGIGEHGVDVDPDAPFAALAMPHIEGDRGKLGMLIAWPLRSGMQIAQDAQALRGYREVLSGIYESTTPPEVTGDAGAVAARNPCWVARKQPVGWMLVCGPQGLLRSTANFLVRAGTRAPEGDAVVDLTFRAEAARPLIAAQIASLNAQDPRTIDAGTLGPALRTQFEAARRSLLSYKEIVDDLRRFHASLMLDDTNYHVRAEADFANATGPSTRALLSSTVGRRTALELLGRLPSTVGSYLTMSLDGAALGPLVGPEDEEDPRVVQALGPEFARFQRTLQGLTAVRRAGERAVGFLGEDGGTKFEVLRIENAAAMLQTVRASAQAVPRTPRASGMNPSEQFAVLTVPATLPAGSLRLRLNPDPARLPPNAPPDLRRIYSRTTLLVPDGDKLYLIEAQDPIAQWNALQAGQRLTVTVPEDRVGLVHMNPMSLLMLLGVPASEEVQRMANGDPIHGTLSARRLGDSGAHFEAVVDAPIVSVNQVRDVIAQLQAQQAQQAQQMEQMQQAQQQRMQQMQAAARRAQQQRGGGMMMPPVPSSPDQLPEPNFQLRPPTR